jgi:uncharacterized protein YcbX
VFMPDMALRSADGGNAPGLVSFADAYPFLLIGQASLDDLNQRLAEPLPMNRFRPNFVVTGTMPYAEDTWRDFHVGGVGFQGVEPCLRCAVTTTDQQTAERAAEPLRTLATYRKMGSKVAFGLNVIGPASGLLQVGADVSVSSYLS